MAPQFPRLFSIDDANSLKLVGFLTWLLVGIPSFTWELTHGTVASPRTIAWMVCYAAFAWVFHVTPHDRSGWWMAGMLGQTLLALACSWLQSAGFQPVLLVIVAAQVGSLSLAAAVGWVVAQSAALAAIVWRSEGAFIYTASYFAFSLFALFTGRIAHFESLARSELARTNAELTVATELLQMSSRTEERLRIARDLHDLLGHHLTALSLNLEVASHLADGRVREEIEKARVIAKHLLSDVRDVVSTLRHDEPVDLAQALASIASAIRSPALHVEISEGAAVHDAEVARVALRSVQEIVTNAARHSGGRNLWLRVVQSDRALTIDAHDDGHGCDDVQFGNGLKGMQERVQQLSGSFRITAGSGEGFRVRLELPLTGAAT